MNTKSETITIRVTPGDKKLIRQSAQYYHMTISDYLAAKGTRHSSRLTKCRKNMVNTILTKTLHDVDTLRNELLNSETDSVDPRLVEKKLNDICKEANSIWHK